MADVPRNPEHYWPTDHATVRKKERGFEWPDVADVIEHGERYDWNTPDISVFHTEEFTVPVNHDQGAIITVCDVGFAEYMEYVDDDGDDEREHFHYE